MSPWTIDFLGTPAPDERTPGRDRSVWELASALARRGHRVRVLFTTEDSESPPAYKGVPAVPVHISSAERREVARIVDAGRAASERLDREADLVVGTDERAGGLKLPSHAGHPAALVMIARELGVQRFDARRAATPASGFRDRLGNWLDRRTLRRLESTALSRARVVFVPSPAIADQIARLYRIPPDRVALLPPGVPEPDGSVLRADARLALRIPPDVPVALFVGRDPERQGVAVALEAFRRSRVFFPGSRLIVVGCNPKQEPGVIPLGLIDESLKARAFRAADLFLLPSTQDGFGLAAREAMRYGLPVVTSPHVPLDGADPKRDFRLVPSGDAADYAAELAELLADPALRRRIGDAGRAYADRFGVEQMAENFETRVGATVG